LIRGAPNRSCAYTDKKASYAAGRNCIMITSEMYVNEDFNLPQGVRSFMRMKPASQSPTAVVTSK